MKYKNKKSQILIVSGFLLISLLLFTYSIETHNFYIKENRGIDIYKNIIFETCNIGKLSNGTYITQRYSNFSSEVKNYCLEFNYMCILNITNSDNETNLSILNYKNFSYSLKFNSSNNYIMEKNFTC